MTVVKAHGKCFDQVTNKEIGCGGKGKRSLGGGGGGGGGGGKIQRSCCLPTSCSYNCKDLQDLIWCINSMETDWLFTPSITDPIPLPATNVLLSNSLSTGARNCRRIINNIASIYNNFKIYPTTPLNLTAAMGKQDFAMFFSICPGSSTYPTCENTAPNNNNSGCSDYFTLYWTMEAKRNQNYIMAVAADAKFCFTNCGGNALLDPLDINCAKGCQDCLNVPNPIDCLKYYDFDIDILEYSRVGGIWETIPIIMTPMFNVMIHYDKIFPSCASNKDYKIRLSQRYSSCAPKAIYPTNNLNNRFLEFVSAVPNMSGVLPVEITPNLLSLCDSTWDCALTPGVTKTVYIYVDIDIPSESIYFTDVPVPVEIVCP